MSDSITTKIKKKPNMKRTFTYVSSKERLQIIKNVGDAGALLFIYYVEKASTPNFTYPDSAAAKALCWKESKVQRVRLALIKEGWFKSIGYVNGTTKEKITVFYLGEDECNEVVTPEEYTQQNKHRPAILKKLGVTTWKEAELDKAKLNEAIHELVRERVLIKELNN